MFDWVLNMLLGSIIVLGKIFSNVNNTQQTTTCSKLTQEILSESAEFIKSLKPRQGSSNVIVVSLLLGLNKCKIWCTFMGFFMLALNKSPPV